MATDAEDAVVAAGMGVAEQLNTPQFLVGLTEAVHAALRAAQYGWAATQEDGPGEAERPYRYENPADSRVAAQVAASAMVEHLRGQCFARAAAVPPELVGKVLFRVRYKPGWRFEPAVLPDGTAAVRVVADLEDQRHPGEPFWTSRVAPLAATGKEPLTGVVLDAALRAVLAIEEHEARERLRLEPDGCRPLDPHELPLPTNITPRTTT
jgi:hypothetical protein